MPLHKDDYTDPQVLAQSTHHRPKRRRGLALAVSGKNLDKTFPERYFGFIIFRNLGQPEYLRENG
jgi:hypothetical protein